MNLVHPAALFLGALAIPIVVFYILKIRLRRIPVSTLLFWEQIFEEKKPRSLWQRMRYWLSLLLQLAFLALLVIALGDPIFRWQQARARRVVLVVDNSASMKAGDVLPNRLEAAKAEGRRLIDGMRLGDELAIIVAESTPRVACGLTDHQRSLREAIDSIAPSDGPTRVNEAVTLARRLLSGSEKIRRAVVLTDGGFEGAADLARQPDIELIGLGRKTGNVGITQLQARRSLNDPIGYEILVEVANASDEPVSCRLELDLEDDPIDVVPLNLKPGENKVEIFEKTSADGGHLRARIDRTDALLADNTAWAILPRRSHRKVTLITPGNVFLEKVFEAIPLVNLEVLKPKEGQPLPAPSATSAGQDGLPVVVYHRVVPDTLPPGNVLVIEPSRSGPLWQLGDVLHNAVVAKQDKDSPLMAHIRLDNVLMPEAKKLTLKAPAHVLAESVSGDPLYAVLDRPGGEGQGKIAVLTVDLDKSDLPLQTVFPIMMTNLMSWFGGTKGELRESFPSGAVAEIELLALKSPQTEYVLRSPDGRERPILVPVGSGPTKVTVGPLDHTGVWSVVWRSARLRDKSKVNLKGITGLSDVVMELPCNLADRRETDLRPVEGISERPTSLTAGWAVRPIWYYLLACAWILTCWEWFLYQRRWID